MQHVRWLIFSLLVLVSVLGSPVQAQGKKYALLVGVETYDPAVLNKLEFAEDDVLAIAKSLEKQGFDCIVMTRQSDVSARRPTTPQKITDQLDKRLQGLEASDTVVVVFSGHGLQFRDEPPQADGFRQGQCEIPGGLCELVRRDGMV